MEYNPILLQVFKNRFSSIAEEMGVTLNRTAFSPNIKERRDFSCAIFDAWCDMIAQAAHIPVHLGSMPLSVKAALAACTFAEGDMVMLNNPFAGGTHLPDITLVAPVFIDGSPRFFVANRAHHADVGGMSAGSMPLSTTLHQEGVIISPVKLVEGGTIDRKLLQLVTENTRTPDEREGDFAAQIMANRVGIRRMLELLAKYGLGEVESYSRHLNDYAERITRAAICEIPDGEYRFTDYLDGDGLGNEQLPVQLNLTVVGDTATLDFSGSAAQTRGSINAVRAITVSAVLYVFRSLIREDIPTNAGCTRPLQIITRPGSIVDAEFPAAVSAGNVETSQRIVDVVLGALAEALPDRIPAASQGTMNNLTIGGIDPRTNRPFAYYETIAGGQGASRERDGESAIHSHMTNTLNTPVEALEFSYPFQVATYAVRSGSGGEGRKRGGDGLVREIRLMSDAEVTLISERRLNRPYGLLGGEDGMPGAQVLVRDGETEALPGKFSRHLCSGDCVRIETPGGGGFGIKDK